MTNMEYEQNIKRWKEFSQRIKRLEPQTVSAEKEIKKGECKSIFGRISRFLNRQQKLVPSSDCPLSLFLIRRDILDDPFPQDLSDYILLLRLLEYKVQVIELPPQIKCEGMGYHLHFEGTQLKWQECLRLQVECVEKKTVFSQRIDVSTRIIDEDLLHNLLNNP